MFLGAERVPEDKGFRTGSTGITGIPTGTDTLSADRHKNTEPQNLTGTEHPSDIQSQSSTLTFCAGKSDASLCESDERALPAEKPTAPGDPFEEAAAASSMSTTITDSGFVTFSTHPSPEKRIQEEEVDVSPLAVTPQASVETHVAFSRQVKESLSPSKASAKNPIATQEPPSQEINKAEEDLGHVSARQIKDQDKMDIALDPVTLETLETSSPQPHPGGEQDNRAETRTDDLKLAEEHLERNAWTEKRPQENDFDVSKDFIQSSSDRSTRLPAADLVIEATLPSPPRTAQHASILGPGVRGQRVRPCSHPVESLLNIIDFFDSQMCS